MEWGTYLQTLAALVFVLALITGVAWLIRRFGAGTLAGRGTRRRRLAVIEVLPLDGRRKLMLVQRDKVEHLLLIGGAADLIVERGIGAPSLPTEAEGDTQS